MRRLWLTLVILFAGVAFARPSRPIPVHAKALAAAFKRDRSAANLAYAGKRLRIAGTVYDVDRDDNQPVVRLNSKDDSINCEFDRGTTIDGAAVHSGVQAIIDCFCEGVSVDGDIFFVECSLPTPERVRAETPELLR
jgi:hypothetical protein